MKALKASLFATGCFLMAFQCSEDVATQSTMQKYTAVIPPMKTAEPKATVFNVDPGMESILEMESGTQLTVPASCFEYEDGTPVQENVQIELTEYRTMGELITSGIPMRYDSAGKSYNFETAGMFKLEGNAGGKTIQFRVGKSMGIKMASHKTELDYQTYDLDEESGHWSHIGGHEVEGNEAFQKCVAIDKQIKALKKPLMPGRPSKNAKILSFDTKKFKDNPMAVFNGILWEYLPDSVHAQEMEFKDLQEELWVCNDIELDNEDELHFKAIMTDGSTFRPVYAKPVLTGRNYKEAKSIFAKLMEKFKSKKKVLAEKKRAEQAIAQVRRNFQLNGFGIFNYDRCKMPGLLVKDIQLKDKEGKDLDFERCYLIEGRRNLVQYYPKTIKKCSFTPELECRMIIITKTGELAYVSHENYLTNIKDNPIKSIEVEVVLTGEKLVSPEQIDQLLAEI